jgi:NADH-ubiquinone oxidoreductase chain 4L
MNLSLSLFLIGILGFILNRKNLILLIISIEIMLLAVTLLILISSFGFDDNIGQTFAIYIIAIAGAESVIGLSILVAYYRLNVALLYNQIFHFFKKGFRVLRIPKVKPFFLLQSASLSPMWQEWSQILVRRRSQQL